MPNQTIGPNITSQSLNDNFAYLEGLIFGQDDKLSVRAATNGNIVLSGTQTIDGVVLVVGDRVLAKNQTTGSQNGPYVVAAGPWTRAADADASGELTSGMMIRVTEGTLNSGSEWYLSTPDPIVLGTTALSYSQSDGLFTIVDSTVANTAAARIVTLISMLANRLKNITGKSTWDANADTTLAALFGLINQGVKTTDSPNFAGLTIATFNALRALSGGYKVQSGTGSVTVTAANSGNVSLTFPSTFATVPRIVAMVTNGADFIMMASAVGVAGATMYATYRLTGTTTVTVTFDWFAIGV